MICLKCKTEQSGNFCGECGEKLRECCAECGGMELTGREAYFSSVARAKKKMDDFVDKKGKQRITTKMLRPMALVSIPLVFLLLCFYTKDCPWKKMLDDPFWHSIFAVIIPCIGFFIMIILGINVVANKWMEKAKNDFSIEFPIEAEILKKAEGEKEKQ